MPETRELMVRRGGAAAVGELSGGFFIRRVTSPGAVAAAASAAAARKRRLLRDWATDDKENAPPWAVGGRHRSRTRRSPLPEWYPRTPLRDITAIVRAIERRNRSRRRATAAQQRTRESVEASPSPDTASSPQEPSVSNEEDTPPIHTVAPSDVSNTTSSTSPTEGLSSSSPSPTPLSLPSGEPSPQTQSASNDPSPAVNEKLSSLIDEMQRLVIENLRRAPQAAQPCKKKSTTAAQRSRVLMSMR